MKKLSVILLFLVVSASSFSQPTTTTSPVKTVYLQKSKRQKTAGFIMLIGGTSCALIMPILWYITPKSENGFNIFEGLFVAGVIAIPASIPLFIAAHQNKKKGMSLSFKTESVPQLQKSSFVYKSLPSLSLKISL